MTSLDPRLEAATLPDGSRRFFPPGAHPATARLRAQLGRIRADRDAIGRRHSELLEVNPFGSPEIEELRRALVVAREAATYVEGQLALFESGESEAKARYLYGLAPRDGIG